MRRVLTSLAVLAFAIGTALPGVAAESFSVPIDQSAAIALPAGAHNVMVGNPSIADVNVVDPRVAVVLGRGYGVTNLLVTDSRGRTLLNRQIVIGAPEADRISVYRRLDSGRPEVSNYACSPRCERYPMPGEYGTDFDPYNKPYIAAAERANTARNTGPVKSGP